MEYIGIDVCEIQGKINWKTVPLRHVNFAMIRASYDLSGVDSEFENNIKNISLSEIKAGAYHESTANNINDAAKEARHFLNTVKPYKLYYPLALKYENESVIQTGRTLVTDIILAFLNTIKNSGYYPIIYANVNWLKSYVDTDRISDFDIWLSDLSFESTIYPSQDKNITIWQYSNKGKIPGIKGNVNLDISYVDYTSILKQRGLNNLNSNSNNQNSGIPLNPETCRPIFYTVEKGDTLRAIAQKIFGDPNKYRLIMELNGLSKPIIYPGQTLRIPKCSDPNIILHRVKQGDTLWKIAEKHLGYGPRYNEIMSANGLTTDMIYPGQILKIPIDKPVATQTYTVKPGDTLWKIAQTLLGNGNRYAEIMTANNLKNGNLRVGQLLNIPKK